MAADVLGGGMHHHVRAMVEGTHQQRRGAGVVHHHGHALGVGHRSDGGNVGHIARGVAHRLQEHRLGVRRDGRSQRPHIAARHPRAADTPPLQHVRHQVMRAAIHRGSHDDVVTRTRQRGQRHVDRGHARGHGHRRRAPLKLRDALLQHGLRGVAGARVDVALLHQAEQLGALLRIFKQEGRTLVNRHSGAALVLHAVIACVQRDGVQLPGPCFRRRAHAAASSCDRGWRTSVP